MTVGSPHHRIRVPEALAASHRGDLGRAWVTALPALAESFLDCGDLRPDGPPAHGVVALVLPVVRADGTAAVLKLQPVDEETRGEPLALHVWSGRDAVRLLDSDPDTGTMLLERLDASRSLAGVADDTAALQILSELLAPGLLRGRDAGSSPGTRRPAHALGPSLRQRPRPAPLLPTRGTDAVACHRPEAARRTPRLRAATRPAQPMGRRRGHRQRPPRRQLPAPSHGRGHRLDRRQAIAWTLGRVLQNALWDIEDGASTLQPEQAAIAHALLDIR